MVFEGIVGLGVALLLAPAIAEYGKVRHKAEKGFNWLAVAGVMFIFAASFAVPVIATEGAWLSAVKDVGPVFQILGWLFALIGVIFVGYEALLER